MLATETGWRQWRQRGWNGDGETAATGKTAERGTAAAQDSFSDIVREMRLERQRQNGGNTQGGSDRDSSGAGFAWRRQRDGDSGNIEAGIMTAKRRRWARWRRDIRLVAATERLGLNSNDKTAATGKAAATATAKAAMAERALLGGGGGDAVATVATARLEC